MSAIASGSNLCVEGDWQMKAENQNQNCIQLPQDVMVEILLRLPPKSLTRFKAVCKSWYALIDSPSFIYRHLDFDITNNATAKLPHLINLGIGEASGPSLHAALLSNDHVLELECPPPSLGRALVGEEKHFYSPLWGPVNGIYCIRIQSFESPLGTLMLWNPGNGHSLVLPPMPCPLDDGVDNFCIISGFGFDSLTNDYKVLGISNYSSSSRNYAISYFHLYSLATNSWKLLDPFEIISENDRSELIAVRKYGCLFLPMLHPWDGAFYFNGACHWLYRPCSASGFAVLRDLPRVIMSIISFDFGSQVFQVYSAPPVTSNGEIFDGRIMSVDGCLAAITCINLKSEPCVFNVYVMREYGVQESWTRAYRVTLKSSLGKFLGIVDQEFFVREVSDGPVVSYCLCAAEPEQECQVYCHVNCRTFQILPYRGSLVPIKPGPYDQQLQQRQHQDIAGSASWTGEAGGSAHSKQ